MLNPYESLLSKKNVFFVLDYLLKFRLKLSYKYFDPRNLFLNLVVVTLKQKNGDEETLR